MGREVVRVGVGDAPVTLSGRALVVNLDWQLGDDLDLAALCVGQHGAELIYYGNVGARIRAPFMHLAHSSEGDGRSKFRREHLVIADRNAHEEIHLFVWDHDAALAGKSAEFAGNPDSYGLSVTNERNQQVQLGHQARNAVNCVYSGVIRPDSVVATRDTACLNGVGEHVSVIKRMADVTGEVRV